MFFQNLFQKLEKKSFLKFVINKPCNWVLSDYTHRMQILVLIHAVFCDLLKSRSTVEALHASSYYFEICYF